nr:aminotransferase class I/II-fold pyridoxal phosphate-dependent enzyme [Chloroflexota bacterium]
ADRTVTINAMSKTYSVTGWRVGWVIASPLLTAAIRKVHDFLTVGAAAPLTNAIRKVHDFLTVGAAAPLQAAGAVALALADDYYASLAADYRRRRDLILPSLEAAGLRPFVPDGAYYVMADISGVTDEDDVTFARRLTERPGVASVPGSSFYSRPELGRTKVRFAFPKREETLAKAASRLATLAGGAITRR